MFKINYRKLKNDLRKVRKLILNGDIDVFVRHCNYEISFKNDKLSLIVGENTENFYTSKTIRIRYYLCDNEIYRFTDCELGADFPCCAVSGKLYRLFNKYFHVSSDVKIYT